MNRFLSRHAWQMTVSSTAGAVAATTAADNDDEDEEAEEEAEGDVATVVAANGLMGGWKCFPLGKAGFCASAKRRLGFRFRCGASVAPVVTAAAAAAAAATVATSAAGDDCVSAEGAEEMAGVFWASFPPTSASSTS